MAEFASLGAPEVLGILLLVVFLIIMSLEIYFFQRPSHFSTLVMVFTLLIFVASLVVILNNDADLVSSVILLLGTMMGIAIGLIMTQNGNKWNLEIKDKGN